MLVTARDKLIQKVLHNARDNQTQSLAGTVLIDREGEVIGGLPPEVLSVVDLHLMHRVIAHNLLGGCQPDGFEIRFSHCDHVTNLERVSAIVNDRPQAVWLSTLPEKSRTSRGIVSPCTMMVNTTTA
jgi:hypothetical protein